MRLMFMGTPSFAVPTLERLIADGHEVVLVVTQPDRPAGRGRRSMAPPAKIVALTHGIAVLQPRRLRDPAAVQSLVEAAPEAIVVAAFGQILPKQVLDIPPLGCLNVHASLLPRHRGAAPITAAILAGDEVTGVTIMLMDVGMDTGPILAQRSEPILPTDTTFTLGWRLADVGAELLAETLTKWARGELRPRPQDDSGATYAPQVKKEDGLLDWRLPAEDLWRRCRAFSLWPGAFTRWGGRLLKVLESAPLRDAGAGTAPGVTDLVAAEVARAGARYGDLLPESGRLLVVGTGEGALALLRVQMESGRPVSGDEFARGHRGIVGARLGE